VLRVAIDALLMFWVSGLWAGVFSMLWIGAALIAAVQLTVHLTSEMSMLRGIAIISLLIAAGFYSLRVAPNDLRQILARTMLSYRRTWRQYENQEKP